MYPIPVAVAGLIGGLFGFYVGFMIGYPMNKVDYQKCRYYDQTIERCVTELGWEKKQ